jgi:hypothetical protein
MPRCEHQQRSAHAAGISQLLIISAGRFCRNFSTIHCLAPRSIKETAIVKSRALIISILAMHFSVRDDCRVPASSQLPRTPDRFERSDALRPARLRASGFASISEALQQVQDQLPWAQHRGTGAADQAAVAVEPKTGLPFQTEYCQRGRSHCGQLAGVGCEASPLRALRCSNNSCKHPLVNEPQSAPMPFAHRVRTKRVAGIKNINGACTTRLQSPRSRCAHHR